MSSDKSEEESPPPFENEPGGEKIDKMFECNICFDTASEPVVSLCGHLYWYS